MKIPMNPYRREDDGSDWDMLSGEITDFTALHFLKTYQGGTIFLSSVGGDIGAKLAIFDHIRSFENTCIVATGVNQSAAAVLLQAADVRIMTRNAVLQYIPPPENRDIDPARWFLHSNLVNLVRERTGASLPEAYDLFDEQMINAERALQLGLIDKIEGREDDYVDPNDSRNWEGIGLPGSESSVTEPPAELPSPE